MWHLALDREVPDSVSSPCTSNLCSPPAGRQAGASSQQLLGGAGGHGTCLGDGVAHGGDDLELPDLLLNGRAIVPDTVVSTYLMPQCPCLWGSSSSWG
jgi:hypothetical protein